MDKYCRICWNTLNWRSPSGDARRLEIGDSYVAYNGFGHEEWLFNFDWLLSGYNPDDENKYRYGFLQPINRNRESYVGEIFKILVYTVNSSRTRMAVACIDDVFVPSDEELVWALEQSQRKGWLYLMRQQLRDLGISDDPLMNPQPSLIANIRFLPQNVTFFNPMKILAPPHVSTRINRYQALDWIDGFPSLTSSAGTELVPNYDDEDTAPDRSEAPRVRHAQPSTVYDPQHSILQNRLREALRDLGKSVKMERDFVDLQLDDSGQVTYIEIKMEITVKNCVRLALGQLMEYAHYPNLHKADRFLVVGDARPVDDDVKYLKYIRDKYSVPLYYARWSWIEGKLDSQI